jgi:hypothetical protein
MMNQSQNLKSGVKYHALIQNATVNSKSARCFVRRLAALRPQQTAIRFIILIYWPGVLCAGLDVAAGMLSNPQI